MLNKSLSKCPYEDWEESAISACSPSENFHCLQDEYDHIGWICTEPIWVEKGRCPVYNSGAKKLDSIFCNTDNCPSENYRSNYAYIKNGCRLNTQKIEDKNKINNTVTTDTGVNKTVPIEYLAIIGVAFLLLLAAVILLAFFIRKRCPFLRRVHVPTTEEEEINLSLLMDTSNDTYTRAGNCLATKRFVVLRGVQGSGKTYLAKRLADNINQISNTICKVQWIYDVLENEIPSLKTKALFVLDDIFYELQSRDEIQKTIKIVEDLFDNACLSKNLYVIVTIPTLAWKIQSEHFQNKTCLTNCVDLDALSKEERTEIFNHHLSRSSIKEEGDPTNGKLIVRNKVKNAIIDFKRYDYMGYPSCIAWISRIQNQMDLNDAGRFIEAPITRITSEVCRLCNAYNTKERKMFLLLALMAFNDGKLDVREHDENQLMDLARILFPSNNCKELALQENDFSLFSLREKYIKKISIDVYEFYLDVVRKIVLVLALEKNLEALKKYVSHYMWKRVAVQRGKLPSDLSVGELSHLFIKM